MATNPWRSYMMASSNRATPSHHLWMGFSTINHPAMAAMGYTHWWKPPYIKHPELTQSPALPGRRANVDRLLPCLDKLRARLVRRKIHRGQRLGTVKNHRVLAISWDMGGFHKWGYPNGWFIQEHPMKMDDLGVPPVDLCRWWCWYFGINCIFWRCCFVWCSMGYYDLPPF